MKKLFKKNAVDVSEGVFLPSIKSSNQRREDGRRRERERETEKDREREIERGRR